ncbi:MAG TPA: glycosyltransferase [Solirubrobacteraceae bacterium]|nr:glycosyltransferase [Solirubrobacteraceae bacterium]
MPEVGVAIAVRDGERWLGAALDSVLAQTLPATDVVVIDDGSRDGSAALAERYAPLVRVERMAPSGIGAARSRAFALVRGELIAALDADDLLTPRSLSARVASVAASAQPEMVFGHVRRFCELGAEGEPVALDDARPAHLPGAVLITRSAYERIGPFATGVKVAEGLDWLLRARELRVREETVPEQVLWRRVHGENNSLAQRAALGEFPRALKASLDRRRGRS